VGQLAGGIAHDFNNILTIIQGHVSLLRVESAGIAVMEDSLNEILMGSERAVNLTQQLLAFSRKQVIQPRKMDLNQALRSMSRLLRPLLSEDIDAEFQCHDNLPLIRADQGMIEQVLLNLVINSRDAMPQGGKLVVSAFPLELTDEESARIPDSRPGPCVCLMVSDTGQGIRPEDLDHIFEPFFTTKEIGKGTGLGLATAYGIVKQHLGWIQVSSEYGKGATFKVFLPVVDTGESDAPPTRVFQFAKRGFGTILVVEDEERLRELICLILANQGYEVLEAPNSTKALEVWAAHKAEIRLLLSDVVMPDGINGLELSARLLEEKPDLKVILSSGYSPQVAGRDLSRMDNLSYLQKPYAPEALIDIIHQSLAP
jgi:CheY-like chemotaxis protein